MALKGLELFVGPGIKSLRKLRGHGNQSEFSGLTSIDNSIFSRLENGVRPPSLHHIEEIVVLLEFPLEDFILLLKAASESAISSIAQNELMSAFKRNTNGSKLLEKYPEGDLLFLLLQMRCELVRRPDFRNS
jgi:hypothetical protein